MSNREATTYNTVLGINAAGHIVILEDTFRYSDDFVGATGVEIYPVYAADIKQAMSEKVEYLRDLANELDAHGEERRQWMATRKDEYLEHRFETVNIEGLSTEKIHEIMRANDMEIEEQPERYTYASLGRIFPRALQGIRYVEGVEQQVEAIKAHERNAEEWAAIA